MAFDNMQINLSKDASTGIYPQSELYILMAPTILYYLAPCIIVVSGSTPLHQPFPS